MLEKRFKKSFGLFDILINNMYYIIFSTCEIIFWASKNITQIGLPWEEAVKSTTAGK